VFNFVCRPDKSDRDKFDWLSLFATTCVDAVEKMLSSLRSSVIKCACECLPEILLFFPFENDFFQRVLKKMILVLKNTKKIFYEKADYAILKILELHPSRELLFPLILEGFNDKHKSIKKFCGMYVYKMLDKWRDKIPLIQMKDCLIQNALDRDEKVRIEAFNIIDLIFTYDPMFVIDSLKPNIPEQKFKHMLSESNYAEMNLLVEKKKLEEKKRRIKYSREYI